MDRYCWECSKDLAEGEGRVIPLELFIFDEQGNETRETRDTLMCEEDAVLFA